MPGFPRTIRLMATLATAPLRESIEVYGAQTPATDRVLTPAALRFISELSLEFEERRQELLEHRRIRQCELDAGALPDFLPHTREIREGNWKVAPIPRDLLDRRVEITGPVDRKMIINALNSGANVFMGDFEDATSPTWSNVVEGQANLQDAVRKTISYTSPEGKEYKLAESVATLMIRPRGWHLNEKHIHVNGKPVSASVFDFGLFLFHNAEALAERGTAPYFYLPKLESHLEARLWNDIFNFSEDRLGMSPGTIRATVLIETILAAFEMDEILYELRDHSAGLNCGRWDYIFSFIKKFRKRPEMVLPNRAEVTMDRSFLKAYVDLLIQTCHRRGIHAMGGMAAQIPIKDDPEANEKAVEKVRQDKIREVIAGHDGTWVAHPGLVPVARAVFDEHMKAKNQIDRPIGKIRVSAAELLTPPKGTITREGLRWNVDVGIRYLASWLGGKGSVPIYNLMEDAATAEICRAQVWQWIDFGARFDDGEQISDTTVKEIIAQQVCRIANEIGYEGYRSSRFPCAVRLLEELMTDTEFCEFLTSAAYHYLD